MVDILSCSLDELRGLFEKFGEKPFRANQVFDWIYTKRVASLSEMTNLSKGLRERLEKSLAFPVMDIAQRQVSSDGTEKFLLALEDGNYIESVLLKHPDHTTFCISSQVGCPLNCSFCATGAGGFTRDLTPGEIVGQVVLMEREQGRPVDNIVFMGAENRDRLHFWREVLPAASKGFAFASLLSSSLGFLTSYLSPLTSDPPSALRRRSRVGVRDDIIGALRDDICGLRKFSSSRERSELSIFLITLHAPLSTAVLTSNPQRATYNGP